MSIKKQAVKKEERQVNVMSEKRILNGSKWQLERIGKNPIQVKDNIIVLDRLEQGVLEVYKPFGDCPVYIQPMDGTEYVRGAEIIAEMIINIHLEENTVSLKKIGTSEEHTEFREIMLNQLFRFAEFYNLEIINEV